VSIIQSNVDKLQPSLVIAFVFFSVSLLVFMGGLFFAFLMVYAEDLSLAAYLKEMENYMPPFLFLL
jgi:hypothetical protein